MAVKWNKLVEVDTTSMFRVVTVLSEANIVPAVNKYIIVFSRKYITFYGFCLISQEDFIEDHHE